MTTVSGQPAAARSVLPTSPDGAADAESSSLPPQGDREGARRVAAATPAVVRVMRTRAPRGEWNGTSGSGCRGRSRRRAPRDRVGRRRGRAGRVGGAAPPGPSERVGCCGGVGYAAGLRGVAALVVPATDGELGQPAEQQEDGEAQCGGDDDREEQLGPLQAGPEVVQHDAQAGFALLEEQVADDGADDREPGGDAEAGEDG